MRRLSVLAAALALVLVPSALAVELTIFPGVGIGKVRLGMTDVQVKRVLGRSPLLNARAGGYTELAWNFASWTVGFERGHAVQIATTLARQRTRKGIGPGSTWRALMRAYPGGACTWNARPDFNNPNAEWPEYLVGHRGGSQTLYVFKPIVAFAGPVVNEVVVRTTFRPLREFAPNWDAHCVGDWQHAMTPEVRLRHG